jgi:hypothetical protein
VAADDRPRFANCVQNGGHVVERVDFIIGRALYGLSAPPCLRMSHSISFRLLVIASIWLDHIRAVTA